MTGSRSTATRAAPRRPGGQRFPTFAVGLILLLLATAGCRLVASADPLEPPAPVVATGPAIADGPSDPDADRETARLLTEGEELLAAMQPADARDRARRIEESLPTADGSGMALWLRARASLELADWPDAEDAAARYLSLIDPAGPFYEDAIVLLSRARWDGDLGGGIETLFQLPEEGDPDALDRAETVAREWALELGTQDLRDLTAEAPPHPRILPPFLVELAVRRDLAGARGEATDFAERALELSPGPELEERARAVVEGRLGDDLEVAAVIGAILPDTGPPSLLQLAREIEEGMELAVVEEERNSRFPVQLVRVGDGSGDQAELIRSVQELERSGVAAAIGPLPDPLLSPAAQARSRGLPILSPSSRTVPEGEVGVFSLTAADPEAAHALARLVLDTGVDSVTVVRSMAPDARMEAEWFQEAYMEGGGVIARTFDYPAGATNFEWPLRQIAEDAGVLDEDDDLGDPDDPDAPNGPEAVGPGEEEDEEEAEPVVLVIIGAADEIQLLAPQLFFYRVREIEDLTIFGSEAWTSDAVLQGIQNRHTDGVLSVTTRTEDGGYGPGWSDFVEVYEDHFQRTLRSPVPALGYDAARLMIHSARAGGGDPVRAREAFEEIRDFPGATGLLSVVDGRIQRAYTPVRIEGGRTIPVFP